MGKGADLTLLDCFQRTKNEDGEFNEMASLKVTRIIISFQKYSFIEVCSVAITFFDFKRNHKDLERNGEDLKRNCIGLQKNLL